MFDERSNFLNNNERLYKICREILSFNQISRIPLEELNSFKNDVFDDNEFSQLKSNDIEYFDSVIEGEESIVIIKRYIFFKNVYVFVNFIKDVIVNKDNEKNSKSLINLFSK